jgi:hypothetical protein
MYGAADTCVQTDRQTLLFRCVMNLNTLRYFFWEWRTWVFHTCAMKCPLLAARILKGCSQGRRPEETGTIVNVKDLQTPARYTCGANTDHRWFTAIDWLVRIWPRKTRSWEAEKIWLLAVVSLLISFSSSTSRSTLGRPHTDMRQDTMSATWRKERAQLKRMRVWKPPHTGLNHNAGVSYCLFYLMSWCLSWRPYAMDLARGRSACWLRPPHCWHPHTHYIHICCHDFSDYKLVLDWWLDLLDSLIQRVTIQFTVTHTLLSTVTYSLPLLGSGYQRRTFPFLWVSELSLASATSFSLQLLTAVLWLTECNKVRVRVTLRLAVYS